MHDMSSYFQDLPSYSLNDIAWDKLSLANQDITSVISIVATQFIQRSGHAASDFFQDALALIGSYFEVETCFLVPITANSGLRPHNSLWLAKQHLQRKNKIGKALQGQGLHSLSNYSHQDMIIANRVGNEVSLGREIQRALKALEVQSVLLIPLVVEQRSVVWLGLGLFSCQRNWRPYQHDARSIQKLLVTLFRRLHVEHQNKTYVTRLEQLVQQQTIALHESNSRFRIMADHSPVLIWVADQTRSCTYFNRPGLNLAGKGLAAELGDRWAERVHPGDLARWQNTFNFAFDRQIEFSIEYRLQRHDGEYRQILSRGVPRYLETGEFWGYVGSCVDVTDRMTTTRKALKQSPERFQLAIAGPEDGLFDWDLEHDLMYLSPQFKLILGYENHELSHQPESWISHLYHEDRDQVLQALHKHLTERSPLHQEYRTYTKSGETRWVQLKGAAAWNDRGEARRFVGVIQDIHRRKQMELELFREKELAQVTLDSIGDAVITTNATGQIEYFNPVAASMTGWSVDDVMGQPISQCFQLIHESTGETLINPIETALGLGQVVNLGDHAILAAQTGGHYHIYTSAAPIRNHQDEIIGAVMVFRDTTQTRQLTQKLSWQASHDSLTKLMNRSEFENRLQQTLRHCTLETTHKHVLCFLDLDRFKAINDTCGHIAGDELLRAVAKLLQAHVRTSDVLARLGGDEFGILLLDCNLSSAATIANKIRDAIYRFRFSWKNQVYAIGVSIGLVQIPYEHWGMEEALSAADAACYAAKERGRNRVHIFHVNDQQLTQQRQERQWSLKIRQALENNRLCLYQQPILPVQFNASCPLDHAEILVRMLDTKGRIIPPGAFLPAAERYDLMPSMDRWVISHSFDQISQIKQDVESVLYPSLWMINLSGASLGDETLLDFLQEQFEQYQLSPKLIGFEITETVAIANFEQASRLINSLKEMGCRFALDDFGSGMSSFGYLKSLPVNYLKIDGQFISNIATDPSVKAMVEAINHVGHVMGIQTIAEWVETYEQRDMLTNIGVDFIQGYGIKKPQPLTFAS